MRSPHLLISVALAVLAGSAALAQDTYHYDLEGRFGWFGDRFDSTVTFTKRADGRYDAVRSWAYREAGSAPRQRGLADVRVRRERIAGTNRTRSVVLIDVTFEVDRGAADTLANLGQDAPESEELSGSYRVSGNDVSGWVQVMGRNGKIKRIYETGERTDTPIDYGDYDPNGSSTSPGDGSGGVAGVDSGGIADVTSADEPLLDGDMLAGDLDPSLRIVQPAGGVYLIGQQIRLESEGASPSKVRVVSGPAKVEGRMLVLSGPGPVRIQLKEGGKISQPVDLEVVQAEIVSVTILDTLEIADAKPPHFARAFGAGPEDHTGEPAAILQDTQLRLKVTLRAAKDLTAPARVRLSAEEASFSIEEEVVLQGLAGGQEVELLSSDVLTQKIQVNTLDLDFSLGNDRDEVSITTVPLRVYTTYGPPVDNPLPRYGPTQRQGLALNTKLHYDLVCTWANGASKNVGNGNDSIGYQVDNQMRHHVHWNDYNGNVPEVPHYPEGIDPPLNYGDIRGWISNGRRGVSSLYYPPLKVTKPVEEYANYRNNFGWWLLDNPTYTGGRCNQQASLICDLVGTLGLEAEVYYIERVGRGKQTGRPMRRFYRSSRSSKSWNFHGQAKVKMEDGSFWLYDGSGSSPPRRINGKVEELMAVPGPYVKYWEAWKYEDGGGYAPMSDWPDTWRGVPLMEGEDALDPNAPDGTYSYKLGRGVMDDSGEEENRGKTLTFYTVNVGGKFITKVGEGTADAPSYFYDVHGRIEDWLGN